MDKEEFLALSKKEQALVYSLNPKEITKLFFKGRHYNRERNIERQLTKKIGIRQVKKLARVGRDGD